FGGRDAFWCARPRVQGGALVRVLAVAEHVGAPPQGGGRPGPAGFARRLIGRVGGREPGRHRDVVGGGVRERLGRQRAALVQGEAARGQRGQHVGVPGGVGDDRDRAVVLGGGPDH